MPAQKSCACQGLGIMNQCHLYRARGRACSGAATLTTPTQAVSHPPTKTPQHSKTRQQDSGLPPTTTEHILLSRQKMR
ncbi:hypothetical protein DIJ64_09690 [Mycobacterium leprae]|uniref:Uncharacterized protein n=1 Tax=Mycobacterium leprae TaxID=1769 RepID=A0AAD2JDQ1_MYCLR|nr:hypothetical protein DIJ64_09690 [Mycobacterium leprae]